MGEITALLQRVNDGDGLARESLYVLLYDDLRRLARSRLRQHEPVTLLDTTSLVHEAFVRFQRSGAMEFADRARFFGFVASLMRSVIVDEVRKRRAERRGGDAVHVELDEALDVAHPDTDQILRVHEALVDLAVIDERLARVVEMRYFAGLTEAEIGEALGLTERTVRRDWDKARTLLFDALR